MFGTIRFFGHRTLNCTPRRRLPVTHTLSRPTHFPVHLARMSISTVSTPSTSSPHALPHAIRAVCMLIRCVGSDAPAAIGPYQQAIKANGFVFVSGCIPLTPTSMEVVEGGFEAQMRQVLRNLTAIVEASGSSLDKVVKTTVRFLSWTVGRGPWTVFYVFWFGTHQPTFVQCRCSSSRWTTLRL